MKGFGTVVTGTLLSGRVRVDDELALLPGERRVEGARRAGARRDGRRRRAAGQRVALNLGGIDLDEIGRGDSLLTPGTLEPTPDDRRARSQVVLERRARCGTGRACGSTRAPARSLGRVALAAVLPGRPERGERAADGRRRRRAEVPGGRARLRPAPPRGAGRPVARRPVHPARLLAADRRSRGGVVLDPHPARGAIRTPAARDALRAARRRRRRRGADADDRAVTTMVERAGRGRAPGGRARQPRRPRSRGRSTRCSSDWRGPARSTRVGQTSCVPPSVLDALGRAGAAAPGRSPPCASRSPRACRGRKCANACSPGRATACSSTCWPACRRPVEGRGPRTPGAGVAPRLAVAGRGAARARRARRRFVRQACSPPDPKEVAAAARRPAGGHGPRRASCSSGRRSWSGSTRSTSTRRRSTASSRTCAR